MLGGLLLATARLCSETPLHAACHPTIGQGPCKPDFRVRPQRSSRHDRSPDPRREPEVRLHPTVVSTGWVEARSPNSDNTSAAIIACDE